MEEEKVPDEEMSSRFRNNILNVLELWASKEAQLEYQKNVPIADVSGELFGQWQDFYYPNDKIFKMAFSEAEFKLLEEFDKVLDRETARVTPYYLPPIELFVFTLEWREINQAAIEILSKLSS